MPSMIVCPECHSPIVLGEHGKTVTRSFRIDEVALAALEEEAARRKVSVNTFLNQQILSFANFERFFARPGIVKVSVADLQDLVNAVSEEDIVQAAAVAAKDTPRSIILSKHGAVTFETTLDFIKTLAEYANLFEYSDSPSPSGRVITLYHRFGPKGSLYYANYVKTLLGQIDYAPKIRTSAASVDFEIPSKKDSEVRRP